jgi:hypothetical protein
MPRHAGLARLCSLTGTRFQLETSACLELIENLFLVIQTLPLTFTFSILIASVINFDHLRSRKEQNMTDNISISCHGYRCHDATATDRLCSHFYG